MTVVFCDLRDFTAFAETAEPEEVMTVLREYHSTLGRLIDKFEGTVERFAGDGLLVLFNDPLPCRTPSASAVQMAVEMRDAVGALAARWQHARPRARLRGRDRARLRDHGLHRFRGTVSVLGHRNGGKSRVPAL